MKTRMSLNSKKLVLALFAVVAYLTSFSQPPDDQRPPMLPDSAQIVRQVERLALDLSLTDRQKENILKLHFAHFNEVKSRKEKHEAERAKEREEMDAFRQKFEKEIEAQLTDEQREKFATIKKSRDQKPLKGDQKLGR